MSTQLTKALDTLTELGWANAQPADVLRLPLGTDDQQNLLIKALKPGTWLNQSHIGENWVANILFYLLRVGAVPDRALSPSTIRDLDQPTVFTILAASDGVFIEEFLNRGYERIRGLGAQQTSVLAELAVRCVHEKNLPILQAPQYFTDWVEHTCGIFHSSSACEQHCDTILQPRFVEHVTHGVTNAVPVTGHFGDVFCEGLRRGWVTREKALELVIQGLTLATRPGDRKRWTEILTTDLQATPEELLPHAQQLNQAVATGETPLIEHIAVPLIPHLDLKELTDHALPALYAKTAKALTLVLKTLAKLTPHPDVTATLGPRIAELTGHSNTHIQKLAAALTTSWGIATPPPNAETSIVPYIPAPPLWAPSPFAPSTSDLAESFARLTHGQWDHIADVASEEFLALAVERAFTHPDDVRRVLSAAADTHWDGVLQGWARGALPDDQHDFTRDHHAICRLERIPCLLSTPSLRDFSLALPDFLSRLERYRAENCTVFTSDLVLALCRLRLTAGEKDELVAAVDKHDAPENDIIAAFLTTCWRETGMHHKPEHPDTAAEQEIKDAWPHDCNGLTFPNAESLDRTFIIFPDEANAHADTDCIILAHHRTPLSPADTVNLLALFRAGKPETKAKACDAAITAFRRGLILPNVADVAYLDGTNNTPTHLAQLIDTTRELADAGLLSVCWPLWEHILNYSHTQPKPLTGIHHVAHAMADYAPSITHALTENQAPSEVAHVPALRALAESKAKNKAVMFAKEAVSALPESATTPASKPKKPETSWSRDVIPHIPDSGSLVSSGNANEVFLQLPGHPQPFEVFLTGWATDYLYEEGRLSFRTKSGEQSWLYWDGAQIVETPRRDRLGDEPVVIPDSFIAVVVAYQCSKFEPYSMREELSSLVEEGLVGAPGIEAAMHQVLGLEEFSPAKALYVLTEKPEFIEHLWPMLTEPVAYAATLPKQPRWLNKVLDAIAFHQDALKRHTPSHIRAEKWDALATLTTCYPKPSAATKKAKTLHQFFTQP
ncbi:hypothetical protein CMUST_09835 [Corynebacterium mustelae]|uniref:Uncharacterized protein n=1 Tax=Corynebacterium mustelae TaxID=571915 RepID=A0A0G3H396_9CORY|nr:hypothetical protein [Corynebacterium mustelae]AKK06283.1 hypothetical protein CMUST_09835 [Corynebacterium mustelae]